MTATASWMVAAEPWLDVAKRVADLSPSSFLDYVEDLEVEDRDEALRMRFRFRRDEFLRYCFPSLFYLPFNDFHRDALSWTKTQWRMRIPNVTRRATAAPRGIAKTTLAKGEMIHDTVYALEGYTIIISADLRGARKITKHIRAIFLDEDSPLVSLYGPFDIKGGIEEFTVSVRGGAAVGFLARSFGTQIRGAEEAGQRPTKVIVDDGERPDRVKNPTLRREDWNYLVEDVLKAGPREGGLLIDWRGTVLHPDSALANLLEHPGWSGRKWQAILSWPHKLDLWEECGRIWKKLTLGDEAERTKAARAFYEEHRAEMDAGAEVLDEVAEPLFKLFRDIWGEGLSSFMKEKQNEPRIAGSSFFDSGSFARCRVAGNSLYTADKRVLDLRKLTYAFRLDPIPGKELGGLGDDDGAGASDWAAIAVIARDEFGYGFVLDCWMRRVKDTLQLAALFDLLVRWTGNGCLGTPIVSIESNGFQRLFGRSFRRIQKERREKGESWQFSLYEDVETGNKEDRIARLDAPVSNEWLQFNENISPAVLGQFDQFPNAAHDDAPDAIEGGWRCSRKPSGPQRRLQ